jgi:hypothetical protein
MNQIHNYADDVVPLTNLEAETLSDAVAKPEGLRDLDLMTVRAKHSISNSTEEKPCNFVNTKTQESNSEASLIKSNSEVGVEKSDDPAPRIRNGFTKIEMQMKYKADQARRCMTMCRSDSFLDCEFHIHSPRRVAKKNSWRNKMILRPDGRPRVFWDCAILFIITYSSFEVRWPKPTPRHERARTHPRAPPSAIEPLATPSPQLPAAYNCLPPRPTPSHAASPCGAVRRGAAGGQIPYSLIFAGASCEWDSSSVLNFAFDLFFLADVAVNFNTAYVDDYAAIVRDHAAIAAQYFRPGPRQPCPWRAGRSLCRTRWPRPHRGVAALAVAWARMPDSVPG